MPRQNFNLSLNDSIIVTVFGGRGTPGYWSSSTSYAVSDADHSEETVSGTSRRKPKGWIPPTGYTLLHKRYSRARGSCDFSYLPPYSSLPGQNYSGCVGGDHGRFNSLDHFNSLVLESYIPAGLENASLIAARNKLKNSKVNLGNAFGERKQLAFQLGDTATRIARAVRQVRKGDFSNAARSLGLKASRGKPRGSNWTDHWLALQYGWKPLLSDIYGAADALSKRQKGDWRVTAKGTKRQKDSFTATWSDFEAGTGTAEVTTSAMTRIDCLPQNEAIISLASLGILNPLEVAWEVTPFSFVVDWVYPIGDWLNSLDAMLGYDAAYTSTSFLQKMKWRGVGRTFNPSSISVVSNSYVESKYVVKLTRTASSGVPMPTLPPLKDGRSLGHMANGLALLSQAFGRSPRGLKTPPRSVGPLFLARYGSV